MRAKLVIFPVTAKNIGVSNIYFRSLTIATRRCCRCGAPVNGVSVDLAGRGDKMADTCRFLDVGTLVAVLQDVKLTSNKINN